MSEAIAGLVGCVIGAGLVTASILLAQKRAFQREIRRMHAGHGAVDPMPVRIADSNTGRRFTQTDVDDAEALGYTDVEARFIAAGMVRQPPTS